MKSHYPLLDFGNPPENQQEKSQLMQKFKHSFKKTMLEDDGFKELRSHFVKPFPDSFKRHFYRILKATMDRKGARMSYKDVKTRLKHMPTSFVCNSSNGTSSAHTAMATVFTHNKKVVNVIKGQQVLTSTCPTHRQRVFFREDMKEELKSVFTNYSD